MDLFSARLIIEFEIDFGKPFQEAFYLYLLAAYLHYKYVWLL